MPRNTHILRPAIRVRLDGAFRDTDYPELLADRVAATDLALNETESIQREGGAAIPRTAEGQIVNMGRISDGDYLRRSGDLIVGDPGTSGTIWETDQNMLANQIFGA